MRLDDRLDLKAAPERGFPIVEFEHRLKRAQAGMDAAGIDILLLTTEPDIRWFTGFLTQFWQSPTRPWFLLVPQSGKPVAVIPGIGAECMARTWIDDIRTWSAPHPEDDGIALLAEAVVELAGPSPRIGLPQGRETHLRMPLADFARLQQQLSSASWADTTALMQGLRAIKSPAEIRKIRHAAQIASRAFAEIPHIIQAGMSEIEAFCAFKIACLKAGADDPAYLVGGAGPGGYGDIISPPTDRPLAHGDLLILDVGCVFDGYFCDFDRNFAIGETTSAAGKAHRVAFDATEAGLAAARPGIRCCDLFEAMNKIMAPHAIAADGAVGRLGHGLGMQLTEHPSLTAWDQTIIEPGMVLTLEPGYSYSEGRMMVHEENIVVTEKGCDLLSRRAPREIPVIAGVRSA